MDWTTAGPPVVNENSLAPATGAPDSDRVPSFSVKVHQIPAGSSSPKSYAQLLPSAQRPAP
jgi:hypothetical protein